MGERSYESAVATAAACAAVDDQDSRPVLSWFERSMRGTAVALDSPSQVDSIALPGTTSRMPSIPSSSPPSLPPLDDETEQQHDSVGRPAAPARPQALLRVFRGGPSGVAYAVNAKGTTIGRAGDAPTASILIDDTLASRSHSRFAFDGTGWTITDLGSRNGAFVDGAVVRPGQTARLENGSVIRIGDTVTVFVTDRLDEGDVADPDFFRGVSAAARRIRRRVEVLARAGGHVLILGETGTGKERVSRQIAAQASSWVTVNCAELSREFARSELFGHVRNVFNGATARDGLVTTAGDGALFLDEIGELPLDVQGDLLRFLEDGTYRPLGAPEIRTSRARIVAATNADLDDPQRSRGFRRDVLARLRSSNPALTLPPLRTRREDIPGWIDFFVREAVADVPAHYCDAGALECLLLYPWPENLRELRSAIRGAVEEPCTWPISAGRLPANIQDHRRDLRGPAPAAAPPAPPPPPPRPADDRTANGPAEPPTREQIWAALRATDGRVLVAAKQLDINRRTLYRLCEKFDIDPDEFRPTD